MAFVQINTHPEIVVLKGYRGKAAGNYAAAVSVKRIRAFLVRNQVFYEVFFIGFFTILSLNISFKANQIAEYQSKLTEKGYSAIFRFIDIGSINTQSQPYEHGTTLDTLSVYNDGSAITDLKIIPTVFYELKYKSNKQKDYKTILIPIDNYYLQSIQYTENPTGELANIYQLDKEYRVNGILTDTFRNLAARNNLNVQINTKVYLILNYIDFLNSPQNELYIVYPNTGGAKLGDIEKQKILNTFRNKYRINFNYAEDYPEYIYDVFIRSTHIYDSKFITRKDITNLKAIPLKFPSTCNLNKYQQLQNCLYSCNNTKYQQEYLCKNSNSGDYLSCLDSADKPWLPCINSCDNSFPNIMTDCVPN